MNEVAKIALVVGLVVAFGVALHRLTHPPNPLAAGENRLAHNFWANTWWAGAAAIILAPVLGYVQGIPAGALALGIGAVFLAGSGAMLRLWRN